MEGNHNYSEGSLKAILLNRVVNIPEAPPRWRHDSLPDMLPITHKFSLLITLPTRRAINSALKTVRNRVLVMTQSDHEGQRVYKLINDAKRRCTHPFGEGPVTWAGWDRTKPGERLGLGWARPLWEQQTCGASRYTGCLFAAQPGIRAARCSFDQPSTGCSIHIHAKENIHAVVVRSSW